MTNIYVTLFSQVLNEMLGDGPTSKVGKDQTITVIPLKTVTCDTF